MRVVFLLGAGVSQAVGLPSTTTMTARLLSGESVRRHTDATYYLGEGPPRDYDDEASTLAAVLNLLAVSKQRIEAYYRQIGIGGSANYEEIYYFISQIEDTIDTEYENAAVAPVINDLLESGALVGRDGSVVVDDEELAVVVAEAREYMTDVVTESLGAPRNVPQTHLEPVLDALRAEDLDEVNILTLNHDSLIETVTSGTALVTGFVEAGDGLEVWNPELFDTANPKLLKLHGSIDWFGFKGADRWAPEIVVRRSPGGDRWNLNLNGEDLRAVDNGEALLLLGTFNKILAYSTRLFLDVHYWTHDLLRRTDAIVVSGYSFGDKAVNARLIGWVQSARGRRVVVLHEDPDDVARYARPSISGKWQPWIDAGILTVLPQWLSNISWPEIRATL